MDIEGETIPDRGANEGEGPFPESQLMAERRE